MRYESYNFSSSFYNASGGAKSDMVLNEMGKLIATEPKAVVLAIQNAGISLPMNSSPADITKTIMVHKGNRRLIQNLSAIILLNEEYNQFLKGIKNIGSKIGGLFKKKGGAGGSSSGGGFFKKIGGFFKRGTNADGTKGASKFGNWFRGNKGAIGDIGGALAGGLVAGGSSGGTSGGGGGLEGAGNYYGGNQQGGQQGGGNVKPPMSMGTKIAIGGGVLVLIVGIVMVMRKK